MLLDLRGLLLVQTCLASLPAPFFPR